MRRKPHADETLDGRQPHADETLDARKTDADETLDERKSDAIFDRLFLSSTVFRIHKSQRINHALVSYRSCAYAYVASVTRLNKAWLFLVIGKK